MDDGESTPPEDASSYQGDGGRKRSDSLWVHAFRDVLERDDIDEETDFFEAGGYSLLVPSLIAHYRALSGWKPPPSLVFRFHTPAELDEVSVSHRAP